MLYLLLILVIVGSLWWFIFRGRPVTATEPLSPDYIQLLADYVPYYASLPDNRKPAFADQVSLFLAQINIEGVETTVNDLDKVLVASSAVMPIFAFEGWQYPNLTTVLLYPTRFNEAYETEGDDRAILGQVGEGGALQSTMVLSKPALHAGFDDKNSKESTGIHEFVHLLDKVDGSIDGTPDYLLPRGHLQPWVKLIHQHVAAIKTNQSDINPYGITNEAEFFAVVSEYFFKRPDLLKTKHPELFATLETIFRQNPTTPKKVLDQDELPKLGEEEEPK